MKTPEEYDDEISIQKIKLANADKNDGEKLKKIQDRIKKLELNISIVKFFYYKFFSRLLQILKKSSAFSH